MELEVLSNYVEHSVRVM